MNQEVSEEEIARWRFRFFGLLLFGVLFLIASTAAFFLALSEDPGEQWTQEQVERAAHIYASQLHADIQRSSAHYRQDEKDHFVALINRNSWPEVPDNLYPFFTEEIWQAYQEKRSHEN